VPTIHLHDTRHTIAHLQHDAGVPPVRTAAFLGHTLAVHLSVYLFAREEDVDAGWGARSGPGDRLGEKGSRYRRQCSGVVAVAPSRRNL